MPSENKEAKVVLPDNRQAVALYSHVSSLFAGDHYEMIEDEPEYEAIAEEMRDIIRARNDRAAGATILWWDSWDKKLTATRFARTVRERWTAHQKEVAGGSRKSQEIDVML